MFGVFLFLTIFSQIIDQMMPSFVEQRTLYEAREQPSKTYCWQSFLFANIVVEMAWNSVSIITRDPFLSLWGVPKLQNSGDQIVLIKIAPLQLIAVLSFIVWYFPIGLYRNAEWTDQVHSRGVTTFLFVWAFFMLASSFGHLMIAGLPNADIAGAVLNLLFIMMFAFCG